MLDFAARLRNFAPFNAFLLHLQKSAKYELEGTIVGKRHFGKLLSQSKTELIHHRIYQTRSEAKQSVFEMRVLFKIPFQQDLWRIAKKRFNGINGMR